MANVFEELERFARRGNPEALISYWRDGEGAARIAWGTEGDFTRCMELVGKYLPEDAGGFCQNRHIEIYGVANSTRDAEAKARGELSEDITELSDNVTELGNNSDLKTKGEHQQKRKCAMCGKSYLGQKNSSTCGDACRQRKSRAGK